MLVFNPIMVDYFASLLNYTLVGRVSDTLIASTYKSIHFSWLGPELCVCCFVHRGQPGVFVMLKILSDVTLAFQGSPVAGQHIISMSPRF